MNGGKYEHDLNQVIAAAGRTDELRAVLEDVVIPDLYKGRDELKRSTRTKDGHDCVAGVTSQASEVEAVQISEFVFRIDHAIETVKAISKAIADARTHLSEAASANLVVDDIPTTVSSRVGLGEDKVADYVAQQRELRAKNALSALHTRLSDVAAAMRRDSEDLPDVKAPVDDSDLPPLPSHSSAGATAGGSAGSSLPVGGSGAGSSLGLPHGGSGAPPDFGGYRSPDPRDPTSSGQPQPGSPDRSNPRGGGDGTSPPPDIDARTPGPPWRGLTPAAHVGGPPVVTTPISVDAASPAFGSAHSGGVAMMGGALAGGAALGARGLRAAPWPTGGGGATGIGSGPGAAGPAASSAGGSTAIPGTLGNPGGGQAPGTSAAGKGTGTSSAFMPGGMGGQGHGDRAKSAASRLRAPVIADDHPRYRGPLPGTEPSSRSQQAREAWQASGE